MASKKSKCWNYFCNEKNRQAKCNLCSAVVATSGGTTNLIFHLNRHHNISLRSETTVTTRASGDVGMYMRNNYLHNMSVYVYFLFD